MKPILEFSAIFVVFILNNILGSVFISRRPDYLKSLAVSENLFRYWGTSFSAILVVLLVASDQPDGLKSVGIQTGLSFSETNSKAIEIGLFSIFLLIFFFISVQKLAQHFRKQAPDTKFDISNPAVVNVLQYRDSFELLAYLTILPFAVIAEDLVYRGYLVLMLGNKTHTFIPWVLISITLSVIIHLYQGRNINSIASQALFAAFFIGLTIVTGNILAPIAGHLYYDIIWTVQTWRKARKSEPQPIINHSKKERFVYSAFIGLNALLLYASLQLISYAG